MPYLSFLKKQQHLKLLSAENSRWRFMGLNSKDKVCGPKDNATPTVEFTLVPSWTRV